MYVAGSMFNVLNTSLQEVTLPMLLINLITFFCSLHIFYILHPSSPQNYSVPQMQMKFCKIHTSQDSKFYSRTKNFGARLLPLPTA